MDGDTTASGNHHESAPDRRCEPAGWLTMPTSKGRVRWFPIAKTPLTIGRGGACDIRVPIPSVGRRHCEIVQSGAFLVMRAIGGTTVVHNGTTTDHVALAQGDRVMIGPVEFQFARQAVPTQLHDPPMIDVAHDSVALDRSESRRT